MESHLSQEELAARSKSAKQQLQMLEQMRKQHQLQTHLAQMSQNGGADNKIKYNRASVSAAIYNGVKNSDETASIVEAVQKQNKDYQASKPKSNISSFSSVNTSLSKEDEADRLRSLVENLSLSSSKSNEKSSNSELLRDVKAYQAMAKDEIGKIKRDISGEDSWKRTNVSSILKDDIKQDKGSNESRDDRTNSSGSGSDIETDNDMGSESAEDYSDDEDEGEDGYKPGGYHRVTIGETYNQR